MEKITAYETFAYFVGAIFFTHILGGILGDLAIGNKNSIVLGGVLQAFGAFGLCLPTTFGLYAGLLLFVLGNGLYTPNFNSEFGKLYLSKKKLLNSGFTVLYLFANIGAFWGIVLIGMSSERYGYNIAFAITGVLMLLSVVPFINSNNEGTSVAGKSNNWRNKNILDEGLQTDEFVSDAPTTKLTSRNRVLTVSIVLVLVGLFWSIYQCAGAQFSYLEFKFVEMTSWNIPRIMWSSSSAFFIIPISLIAAVVWSRFYSSHYFKLMLGFVFGTISFSVLFLIPEIPTETHASLYLLAILSWGIAEVYIAPISHSVLTKYANPKYLAILMSLVVIPNHILSSVFTFALTGDENEAAFGLQVGLIAMAFICVGLIGFVLLNKKPSEIEAKSQ